MYLGSSNYLQGNLLIICPNRNCPHRNVTVGDNCITMGTICRHGGANIEIIVNFGAIRLNKGKGLLYVIRFVVIDFSYQFPRVVKRLPSARERQISRVRRTWQR